MLERAYLPIDQRVAAQAAPKVLRTRRARSRSEINAQIIVLHAHLMEGALLRIVEMLPPNPRRSAVSAEAEAIARFRCLPWVRPENGAKPALPKPLLRIGKGEKTLAAIVSDQRE